MTTMNKTTTRTAAATKTYAEGLLELETEAASGKPHPKIDPTELPRESIKFATSVFQPRTFVGAASADSSGHKRALAEAIRNTPDHQLDPVTVWWSGKYWRVIDGHHRLMAYAELARDKRRPINVEMVGVQVFKGTLTQAIERATELNSRDKLMMTLDDKIEQAWKLVKQDDPALSRPRIARVTGASERTVGNMREAFKRLTRVDDGGFDTKESMRRKVLDMTWREVKRAEQMDDAKGNDDFEEKEALHMGRRLLKEFGPGIRRKATTLARALEIVAPSMPGQLVRVWIEIAETAVEEQQEEHGEEGAF